MPTYLPLNPERLALYEQFEALSNADRQAFLRLAAHVIEQAERPSPPLTFHQMRVLLEQFKSLH